jgi:hypothetical protein
VEGDVGQAREASPHPSPALLATLPLLGRGRRRPRREGRRRRRRRRRRWRRRDLEFPSAAAAAAAAPRLQARPPPGALLAFGVWRWPWRFPLLKLPQLPGRYGRSRGSRAEPSRGEQSTRHPGGLPPHPHPAWLPSPTCVPLPCTPKSPTNAHRPRGQGTRPCKTHWFLPLHTTSPCPCASHVPCHFHQLHYRERAKHAPRTQVPVAHTSAAPDPLLTTVLNSR